MPINRFPIQLRFGDEDSNGHVNNVRYVQFLEEARVRLSLLPLPGVPDKAGSGAEGETFRSVTRETGSTLVARQEIEYLTPLTYRSDPVWIEIWVSAVGRSSFSYGFRLTDEDSANVYAVAEAAMVMVGRESGRPEPLSERQREILESWAGSSVPFRGAVSEAAK
ncbi:thioesterase family protein [Arthrobacter koreensis]|uniref:acyl-CoA thioesterase n=1 Tax=Arthrobacter koreensis TaxID=199136 RepID=UPI002DBC820C|nr:thioesterase family protein [Arthrobacter koreensis]MEB7505179.1 acyl-CoA thioesterase [Arthrobacter koreensis]